MAATYSSSLPTDQDWVRFLIGDTVVSGTNARLQDEEIAAVLAEESSSSGSGPWLKYLAAARCLTSLYARWQAAGNGVIEKQVAQLRIRRAEGQDAAVAMEKRIDELRARGAALRLANPGPSVFEVI